VKEIRVLDGGYISWVYGSRQFSYLIWSQARIKYLESVILQDSKTLLDRKKFFPPYKSHREQRVIDNPRLLETQVRVMKFKKYLWRDPAFELAHVEGLEADDLIAVAATVHDRVRVIGADKDLLQISQRRLTIEKIDGSFVTFPTFVKRLPKTLWPHISDEWDIILILSIIGDRSDDIPRILPPRDFDPLIKILHEKKPFSAAAEHFGEDFIRNLYISVLPGPWAFDPIPEPSEMPELLESGTFPMNMEIRKDILEVLNGTERDL